MKVYLLWHVGHQNEAGDDGTALHVDDHDDVYIDEHDGDNVKLLGVYSTFEKAQERRTRARTLPGFATEPECFVIDEYTVDQDTWAEGFKRARFE
ncbi:DUF7336 domain-containing protein [Catenulispora pinisilvae]|uniref:DUF7336 domain-containing protein n=1 Tax=Catenulispora pinisilvae TaxID=2705253 RepID=UPI0018912BB6|nr:hypothetical protein [Catenulispora pinisilvae]